ncbi:TcpQ domain-containing protein [Paraburkholderia fungorum]|uniref:TcpQ domain-containing protein n=1 Tax=Paraburkholderia fungorum TaxID=134537 RepID=A0AAP5UV34_9BURK|nr:OmpA family protein [Paraburkholderia fungorum]MDT8840225.1 TcpQ domain-containing protein [Paraburkholderia fungorum]
MGNKAAISRRSWRHPLAACTCVAIFIAPVAAESAGAMPLIASTQDRSSSATRAVNATLSADAMFRFGSSTLSAAGTSSLSTLFDSLGGTSRITHLSVVGHTDAIGTATYNERLSVARANSVRGFFIQQGVPADSIDTSGVGDTSPVTTNCPRAQTAEAIRCRAPDRRVELRAIVRGESPALSSDAGFIDLHAGTPMPQGAASGAIQIAAIHPTSPNLEPSTPAVAHAPSVQISPAPAAEKLQPISQRLPDTATAKDHVDHPADLGSSVHDANPQPIQIAPAMPVATPAVVPENLQPFELKAGLPLEDQILEWARRSHWAVLWNIPGNWTAPNNASFGGSFEQAAIQVFDQMGDNGADIWVDVWEGNNTIIVTPTGSQGAQQ